MEEERECSIEDWDELFELYRAYCAALDADRDIERPWHTRENFREWVEGLAPHVRRQSIEHWRKGLQQVLAEERSNIQRHLLREHLGITVAGEG